ncbi:MAG: hypothetical protein JW769_00265 [Parachlamydiales bacterium]|nr:hypothetical protein [Parachlamydiales bacterium]
MKKLKTITHLSILISAPSLFAYPQNHMPHVVPQRANWLGDWWWGTQEQAVEWVRPTTYDEIIQMLDDLESGELEKRYSPEQLERVNEYLATLAREGILPNEFDEEADLEEDSYDLLYGEDSGFQLARYLESSSEYMIVPAVLNGYSGYNIVQCGKISKAWKKTKKFCKKHKKAIIIGAVFFIAAGAVTVAMGIATSASVASAASTAAGAAGAASGSGSSKSESSGSSSSTSNSSQTSSNTAPTFQRAMEDQFVSFKEHLAGENFFQPSGAGQDLSIEETGRVAGSLFAHDSFNYFNNQIPNYPQLSEELRSISSHPDFSLPPGASDNPLGFGHDEIDSRFASNCGPMFSDPSKEVNIDALSYQMRGEAARHYGYYGQAVDDFSKVISMNPTDPMPYLQRSGSYFDMGQYDQSFKDFREFTAQVEKAPEKIPFSTPEFTLGFAKGLPKGVYESGKGIMLFLGDLVTHPIHTSTQMYQALSTLARLARDDEWGVIGEVLSPEIHQLVTQWDTLPSEKRGELAGYAFGKHGVDIAAPGAVAKIASKSAKSARELAAVMKNLRIAEETLVLETAAGVGNTVKVGEIVNSGKSTLFLGEELGFTAKEMGHLKQAGKLETTVTKAYEHLNLPMQESIKLFDKAQEFLKPYREFMPEVRCRELIHKAGFPTFPRPQGIPKNFRVKVSDKGAGMIYYHPEHTHTSIRVMPGKPHSPWPHQQKPYVIQTKNGRILDKAGNVVSRDAPEAHIALEEFIFIGD